MEGAVVAFQRHSFAAYTLLLEALRSRGAAGLYQATVLQAVPSKGTGSLSAYLSHAPAGLAGQWAGLRLCNEINVEVWH